MKLLKNLYGQKQAGQIWNQHLTTKLIACELTQSHIDEYVFYFKKSVFLVITDDTILMGPDTDASHAGKWNRADAMLDATTAKSRTGYMIKYTGCPMLWASKLQTKIALSSTESEYIMLSQVLREVIPLTSLIKEAQKHGIDVHTNQAKVRCTMFEDNTGTAEIARVPKMQPCTKRLNINYHHFREHVKQSAITIEATTSEKQLADIYFCSTNIGNELWDGKCTETRGCDIA